jgi:hypothetical protein
MRTYFDCIPCFFRQALAAARMATDDDEKIKELMNHLGNMLPRISYQATPPEVAMQVYAKVTELTGVADPYRKLKEENTAAALRLYPAARKLLRQSDDQLLTAIRLAIAGNIIDFGPDSAFTIQQTKHDVLGRDFAIFDYAAFKRKLKETDTILYIGDNAGEAVFDRLLIETLDKPVTFAVRDRPIINDAIYEDAVAAGIPEVAGIISSGSGAPGVIPDTCSAEFLETMSDQTMIIAKGMGNFEALSETSYPVFFLLLVKCEVIGKDVGVPGGSIVLKGINV